MQDPAQAIPVLASLEIGESRAFYVDNLGFQDIYRDDAYLIVRRDRMEVHM